MCGKSEVHQGESCVLSPNIIPCPERQPERWPREKTTEHKFLTPVFGTSCPPKGLSGVIRRHAYRRYSEGRLTHWLLLVLGDRVDVVESRITGILRGRPDNPFAEAGLKSEIKGHGLRSRRGQHRAPGWGPAAELGSGSGHIPPRVSYQLTLRRQGSSAGNVSGRVALQFVWPSSH